MRSDSEGVIQPGVAAGHSCAEKKGEEWIIV